MQETTTISAAVGLAAGASSIAASSDIPPLAFADAQGASAWVKTLPFASVSQLNAAVLGQLRALAAAELAPRERATIAEVFREQVRELHTELARRYAGKAHPATERENEAFGLALALWTTLWEQYSACLKPLIDGEADVAGVKAKILQRGLYVGKQILLVYALGRRLPPTRIWEEIHAYYQLAELLECAVSAVSDDLMPNAVGISCYSTYSHALLFALADPWSMNVKQIELTDRWLALWARKVFPYAQQRESEGPVVIVDLHGKTGAAVVAAPPRHASESMRFGYPGKLVTSVRGRLRRLQGGASPAELQLGNDCSVEQCTALLSHRTDGWFWKYVYEVPRAHDFSMDRFYASFANILGHFHVHARQDAVARAHEVGLLRSALTASRHT